jgi:glycosyltransferase involved in cell wall biosynthesis
MRIVIDLQAAQAENRARGIGRYSLSLALAMVRNHSEHEIIIALNGLFPDSIDSIREAFVGLLPQENIRVWYSVGPVAGISASNDWRRQSAELVREAFLSSLRPDMVHVSSLFEGLVDDAVTSIGALSTSVSTAVTLYDLIPYIHRKPYLENSAVEAWYLKKIEHLRRADLWLAISDSSRKEGNNCLGLPEERSVNISTDADAHFKPIEVSPAIEEALRQRHGLHRRFIMYTGGIDHRKNIEGLIRAFSKLPEVLRNDYQLAVVCSVQPESRRMLEELAAQAGLSKGDVVLTGFVPEDDLLALYNLCSLFVFPSWHEGFGLPALEAMRCGAPVIGANTSSIPEVIGWNEALFDPHTDEAITAAICHALSDEAFRAELVRRGKQQAEKFSWDETARRAIAAMERLHAEHQVKQRLPVAGDRRPKLAYVSPLPPEKSGIADYSAELLPELAKLYDIEVIVAQDAISDSWINANCPARSVQWLVENRERYDRVLYHFGNSAFHQHMFDLLKAIPGVVVLHDFFLSGVVAHADVHGLMPGSWVRELYKSHGYPALIDKFKAKDNAKVIWKYPCSLSVIQDSLGVIVHSPNSLRLAEQWYGCDSADWEVIPHMRDPLIGGDRIGARKALGFEAEDFLVCAFGILGPMKLNLRLLHAWLKSSLPQNKACHLVFVGENQPGAYGQEVLATISRSNTKRNIHITGWVGMDTFRQYLTAANVGVQLRTLSRGETSGTVLDCMNYGLATIVNANGSMADLDERAVWKLPDEFSDEQLIVALETLWTDETRRNRIGQAAREIILRNHNPQACAEKYGDAIERFYQFSSSDIRTLPVAIATLDAKGLENASLIQVANAIANSIPPRNNIRQILVDVSELAQRNSKSGIQRVVCSVLREWLSKSSAGLRIEPVYATVEHGYRYARRFTAAFLEIVDDNLRDDPIDYAPGDIFFGLDMQPQVQTARRDFYQHLRRFGVKVSFLVHDLLCILQPQYFLPGAKESISRWLEVIGENDGAVCVSKTVADELACWMKDHGPERLRPFRINWSHNGADIDNSAPTLGLPADAEATLATFRNHPSFLMVGTLEPRKGHAQVLGAFEQLWVEGVNANLVIVGKQGWMVEELVERVHSHSELNKRLFWLDGISDEYLGKIYAESTCLIAASYGEGFGLPLIEAAQYKLPILARDIPVFREVAGNFATYFSGTAPEPLAAAIDDWLQRDKVGQIPAVADMPWLTWSESATHLIDILINETTA